MITITQEAAVTGHTEQQVRASRAAHEATSTWETAQLAALTTGTDRQVAAEYGSPDWINLPADDPRRAEALIVAARAWRLTQTALPSQIIRDVENSVALGEALRTDLYAEWEAAQQKEWDLLVQDVRAWANHPTAVERSEQRLQRQVEVAREPVATTGWPPIVLPGRPGWRRHLVNGQQVDIADSGEAAA